MTVATPDSAPSAVRSGTSAYGGARRPRTGAPPHTRPAPFAPYRRPRRGVGSAHAQRDGTGGLVGGKLLRSAGDRAGQVAAGARVAAIASLIPLAELERDPFLVDTRSQHAMCDRWASDKGYVVTRQLLLCRLRPDHRAL